MKKKVFSIVLAIALIATAILPLASCGKKKYTIGICQLVQHEALDAATKGFKDALIKEFGAENITFDEQNASGDSATCTSIVNNFVAKNVNLILANATPALQAAAATTKIIPILGTSVTEYGVALGIENFNGVTGTNISGTSDLAPLDQQAQMIIDLVPTAKNVGILYCSAEANSAYQVKVVKEYLTGKGLTVTGYSFSDSNDVSAVTTTAAANSDVIYIPTDNTAASCVETIGNIVNNAKVPVIAGEAGLCKGCGIATLSISYYDLGVKTGEMAAKILKGEEKIDTMSVQYAEPSKYYNKENCAALGITVPAGYEELK